MNTACPLRLGEHDKLWHAVAQLAVGAWWQ